MKEYIERAEALDICQKEYEDRLRMADYCGDTVAWDIGGTIKGIPAADVAEVRHGRWVRDKWPSGTHKLICSECREWSGKKSRYCPSCGAHMDKEGSNDSDRDV